MRNWNSVCSAQRPREFTDAFPLRPEILCHVWVLEGADAELEQRLLRPAPQRIYGRISFAAGNTLPCLGAGRGRCGTGMEVILWNCNYSI